jgi:hypothetical protein
MSRKKTKIIYNPVGLNSEQKEYVEGHEGDPETVRSDFAERFKGCEITRKLVRQVRKRQQQRDAA